MARVRAIPFGAWVCRESGRHCNRMRKERHEPLGLGNRQDQREPTIQREVHLATV
jgi:adenine/guanine phosphoribosyltransferase-like PRPP-binding protein